jgi:glycosyltransferase involved in cell wall biosynthesis
MMNIYSFTDESKPFTIDDLNEMVYGYMERTMPMSENNKYTIYIPSKGRARTNKATRTLSGLNYKLVVEPQDYDEYCLIHSSERVVRLDKNNQGLAYARNFIKQYSRTIGEEYHWQVDDDIEVFKFRKKNVDKNEKVNAIFAVSIVEYCTDMFTNVAVSGINSDTFAFSRSNAVQKNKLTCQCVLVNNSFDIDWAYGGVEDWHYTLLSLEKGYCTLAFDHIMTHSPPPGKQAGGNTNTHYSDNILKPMLQEFVTLWPGRFNIKEEPLSQKKWRLKPARKFFSDYKQNLILNNNVSTIL